MPARAALVCHRRREHPSGQTVNENCLLSLLSHQRHLPPRSGPEVKGQPRERRKWVPMFLPKAALLMTHSTNKSNAFYQGSGSLRHAHAPRTNLDSAILFGTYKCIYISICFLLCKIYMRAHTDRLDFKRAPPPGDSWSCGQGSAVISGGGSPCVMVGFIDTAGDCQSLSCSHSNVSQS